MHELGIVFYILDDVKKVALENNVEHVNSVTLEVGEVSTVIPEYLLDCWNWATNKNELTKDCELKIETIKAFSYCETCKTEFETVKYGKTCPKCGGSHTHLVKGDEINIKEIEVI